MGKLKASLAKSEADQELQSHLAKAGRELEQSLDVCRRVIRDRSSGSIRRRSQEQALQRLKERNPTGSLQIIDLERALREQNPEVSKRRAQEYMRQLQSALAVVNSVGHLVPDSLEDVDLLPEDTQAERSRERRADRAKEAAEKKAKSLKEKVDIDEEE